jgi:hypothetical protein
MQCLGLELFFIIKFFFKKYYFNIKNYLYYTPKQVLTSSNSKWACLHASLALLNGQTRWDNIEPDHVLKNHDLVKL